MKQKDDKKRNGEKCAGQNKKNMKLYRKDKRKIIEKKLDRTRTGDVQNKELA